MSTAKCPRCADLVSLPNTTHPQARVQCPLCHESFELGELLERLPPPLIILELPPGAMVEPKPSAPPSALSSELGLAENALLEPEGVLPSEHAPLERPLDDNSLPDGAWSVGGNGEPTLIPQTGDEEDELKLASNEEKSFSFGAPIGASGMASASISSGTVSTPGALKGKTRPKRKERSPIFEIAKMVMGGVVGIVGANVLLWWLPGGLSRDMFQLGPKLSKISAVRWAVPEKYWDASVTASGSSDKKEEAPKQEPSKQDGKGNSSKGKGGKQTPSTKANDQKVPANDLNSLSANSGGFVGGLEDNSAMPAEDGALTLPEEMPAEGAPEANPEANPTTEPPAEEPAAPTEPEGDPTEPSEPAKPTDPPAEEPTPEKPAEKPAEEPAEAPAEEPKTEPAKPSDEPMPEEPAEKPTEPKEVPKEEPTPPTEEPTPDKPAPEKPAEPAGEPMPEPPPEPANEPAPIDGNVAKLGQQSEAADASLKAYLAATEAKDLEARRSTFREMYAALAEAGAVLNQLDPKSAEIAISVQTVQATLAGLPVSNSVNKALNTMADKSLEEPSTGKGIALRGSVKSFRAVGNLFETSVELTTGSSVLVVTSSNPQDVVKVGDGVQVVASMIKDPAQNLPGYKGDSPLVLRSNLLLKMELPQ